MRPFAFAALLALATAGAGSLQAQVPAGPKKTTALVASFPDKFTFIETMAQSRRNGAVRVDRDRRSTADAAPGTFNKIALAGLDRTVAELEPVADRVLVAIGSPAVDRVAPAGREDYLLSHVKAVLEKMPQRLAWSRILVALPAFRVLDVGGLPARIEGFGVVLEPNCQGGPDACAHAFRFGKGPDAESPTGEAIRANFFVAPYSYIAVLTLDPKTLEVLDRQTAYDHQKMYDPNSGTLDLGVNIPREILATKVVNLIERSFQNALAQERIGKVNVKDVREVKPDAEK